MAKLHDAGTITIGTKFDQPLFGLKGPDNKPVGFDVEIGKIIAGALGIARRQDQVGRDRLGQPRAVHRERHRRHRRRDLHDQRQAQGSRLLRRTVLQRRPGHPGAQGQPGEDQGPGGPQAARTSAASPAPRRRRTSQPYGVNLITTDTYSNCLEPLRSGKVIAVTTDNVILAGLADQNEGEFEVVGNPFTEEPYGIGLKKDDTEFRNFINDMLEKSYKDGTWKKAWEDTAGKVLKTPEPPAVDRY